MVATKADPDNDLLTLAEPMVYFNLADAKEKQVEGSQVLAIIVPFPQRGDGTYEGDPDDF